MRMQCQTTRDRIVAWDAKRPATILPLDMPLHKQYTARNNQHDCTLCHRAFVEHQCAQIIQLRDDVKQLAQGKIHRPMVHAPHQTKTPTHTKHSINTPIHSIITNPLYMYTYSTPGNTHNLTTSCSTTSHPTPSALPSFTDAQTPSIKLPFHAS